MHSSRMRTGRSLTVCRSLLPGGVSASRGVSAPRGVYGGGGSASRWVSAPGGSTPMGGLLPRGGYPIMHWGRLPPPLTESQTPVKTLPWPNFVATGNNKIMDRN